MQHQRAQSASVQLWLQEQQGDSKWSTPFEHRPALTLQKSNLLYNVLQCVVRCPYVQVHHCEHSRTVVHRVGLFDKTGHSLIRCNVLQCAVRCLYVQVHNGEHSRTVVHRVGILYNMLQGVVRCLYVQVHNGEHSRTVVHRVGLFIMCYSAL